MTLLFVAVLSLMQNPQYIPEMTLPICPIHVNLLLLYLSKQIDEKWNVWQVTNADNPKVKETESLRKKGMGGYQIGQEIESPEQKEKRKKSRFLKKSKKNLQSGGIPTKTQNPKDIKKDVVIRYCPNQPFRVPGKERWFPRCLIPVWIKSSVGSRAATTNSWLSLAR